MSIFKKRGSKSKGTDKPATDSLSLEALDAVAGGAGMPAFNKEEEHILTGGGLLAPSFTPVAVIAAPDHTQDHAATNAQAAADAGLLASGRMDVAHAVAHVEQVATDHHVSQLSAVTELLTQSHGNPQVAATLTSQINSGELAHDLAGLVKAGHMTSDQVTGELSAAMRALHAADHTPLDVNAGMALNKAYAQLYNAAGEVGATALLQHLTSGANDLITQHGLVQLHADHNADLVAAGKMTVAAAITDLNTVSAAHNVDRETALAEFVVQTHGNPAAVQALTDRILSGAAAHDLALQYHDGRAQNILHDVVDVLARMSPDHEVGGRPVDLATARVYAQLYNEAAANNLSGLQAALNSSDVRYDLQVGLNGLAMEKAAATMAIGDAINTAFADAANRGLPKDLGAAQLLYATNGNPAVSNAILGRLFNPAMDVVTDDIAKFWVGPGTITSEQAARSVAEIAHALAEYAPNHKVNGLTEDQLTSKLFADLNAGATVVALKNPGLALHLNELRAYIPTFTAQLAASHTVQVEPAAAILPVASHISDLTNQVANTNSQTAVTALTKELADGTTQTELVNLVKAGKITSEQAITALTKAVGALAAESNDRNTIGGIPQETSLNKAELRLYELAQQQGVTALTSHLDSRHADDLAAARAEAAAQTTGTALLTRVDKLAQQWTRGLDSGVDYFSAEAQARSTAIGGSVTVFYSEIAQDSQGYGRTIATSRLGQILFSPNNDGTGAELANLIRYGSMTTAQAVGVLHQAVDALAKASPDHLVGGLPPDLAFAKAEALLYTWAERGNMPAVTQFLKAADFSEVTTGLALIQAESSANLIKAGVSSVPAAIAQLTASCQDAPANIGAGLTQLLISTQGNRDVYQALLGHLTSGQLSNNVALTTARETTQDGHGVAVMTTQQGIGIVLDAVSTLARFSPDGKIGGLTADMASDRAMAQLFDASELQPGLRAELIDKHAADVRDGNFIVHVGDMVPAGSVGSSATAANTVIDRALADAKGAGMSSDTGLTILLSAARSAGNTLVQDLVAARLIDGWAATDATKITTGTMTAAQAAQDMETRAQSVGICATIALTGLVSATKGNAGVVAELAKDVSEGTISGDVMRAISAGNLNAGQAGQVLAQAMSALAKYSADHMVLGQPEITATNAALAQLHSAATAQGATALAASLLATYNVEIQNAQLAVLVTEDAARINAGQSSAAEAIAHITREAGTRGISPVVALTDLLIDTKGNAAVIEALTRALTTQGLGVLPQFGAGLTAAEQQAATANRAAQTVEALIAAVDTVVRFAPAHTFDGAPREFAVGKLLFQLQSAAGTAGAVTAYLNASHDYEVRVGSTLSKAETIATAVASGSTSLALAMRQIQVEAVAARMPAEFGLTELLYAANRLASSRPSIVALCSGLVSTLTTSMFNSNAVAQAYESWVNQGLMTADQAADGIATMANVLTSRAAGDTIRGVPDAMASDVALAKLYNAAVQTGNTALQQSLLAQHAGDVSDGRATLSNIDLAGRIGASFTIAQAITAAEQNAAEHKTSMLDELVSLAAVTTGANATAVKAEIARLLSTDAGERDLVQAVAKGWVAAADASAVIKAATAAAGLSQNDIENTYAQLWNMAGNTANAASLVAYLKEHDTMLTGAGLARTWSADAIHALNSSTTLAGGTPDAVYRTAADAAIITAITRATDFGVPRLVALTQIMEDLRAQCGLVQQLGPTGPYQALMGVDSLHLSTRTQGIDYRPYIMMEEAFRLANLAQQGEQELAAAVNRGVLSPKGALAVLDDFITAANGTYSKPGHLELEWVNQTYARLCRDGNAELQQELKLNHAKELELGMFQVMREARSLTNYRVGPDDGADAVNRSIQNIYGLADALHATHTQALIYLLGESHGNPLVATALANDMFGVNGGAVSGMLAEFGRGMTTEVDAINKLAAQVHTLYSAVGTSTITVSGVALTEAQAVDVVEAKFYREAVRAGNPGLADVLLGAKLADLNVGMQLLIRQEAYADAEKVANRQMTIAQAIAHTHQVAEEVGKYSPKVDASEDLGLIMLLSASGNNAAVAAALSQRFTSGAAEAELATLAKQGILSQAQALQVIADATDALQRAGALQVPRDDYYNSAVGRLYIATSDVNDPTMASFLIAREAAHINAGNQALVRDLAEQVKGQPVANAIAQVESFAAKALVSVEWGLVQLMGRTQGASTVAVAAELTTRLTGALPVTDLPLLAGLGQLTDVAAARDLQALGEKGAMTAAQILQLGHDAINAVMRAAPSALHMTADQAFDILGTRLAIDANNANNTALMQAVQASDREVASLARDQRIADVHGAAFRSQVATWIADTGNLADRMADATVENTLARLIRSGQTTSALAMQALADVVRDAAGAIPSGWGLSEAQLLDASKLRLHSRVQGTDLETWMEARYAADLSRAASSGVVGKLDVAAVGAGYMTAGEAVADFMSIAQATSPSAPLPMLTRFYQDAASQPAMQQLLASNMASLAVDAALRTSVTGLTVPAGGDAYAALAARVAQGAMTPEAAHQALAAAATAAAGQLSGLGVNRVSAELAADIAEARLYDAAPAGGALQAYYQAQHPFAIQTGHMAMEHGATPYVAKWAGVEREADRIAGLVANNSMSAADAITVMTNYANSNQLPAILTLSALASESHGNAAVVAALQSNLGNLNSMVAITDAVQAGTLSADLARDMVGDAARAAWPQTQERVQYCLASLGAGLRANELRDALAAHTITPQQAIDQALNTDFGAGVVSRNSAGVAVDGRYEGRSEYKYAFFGELALALLAGDTNDPVIMAAAGSHLGHGEFSQDVLNGVRDGVLSPASAVQIIELAAQQLTPGSRELASATALARLEMQALAIPPVPAMSSFIDADEHRIEQVMTGLGALITAERNPVAERRMQDCVAHMLALPMAAPTPPLSTDEGQGGVNGTLKTVIETMLISTHPMIGAYLKGAQMTDSITYGVQTGAGYVAQYAPMAWSMGQDKNTLLGILGHEIVDQKGKDIDGWVHLGAQVAATGFPLGGPLGSLLGPSASQYTGFSVQSHILTGGAADSSAGLYFTVAGVGSAAMLFALQQKVVADTLGPIATGTLKGVFGVISASCATFSGVVSAGVQTGAQNYLDMSRGSAEAFIALCKNDISTASSKAEQAGDVMFRAMFGASLQSYADTGRSLGNVVVSLFSADPDRVVDNCRALGTDVVNMIKSNPALVKAAQVIDDNATRIADAMHLQFVGNAFRELGDKIEDTFSFLTPGERPSDLQHQRAVEEQQKMDRAAADWNRMSDADHRAVYDQYVVEHIRAGTAYWDFGQYSTRRSGGIGV